MPTQVRIPGYALSEQGTRRAISELLRGSSWRVLVRPTATVGLLFVFIGTQLAVLSIDFGDRYAKYFAARLPTESELYGGRSGLRFPK